MILGTKVLTTGAELLGGALGGTINSYRPRSIQLDDDQQTLNRRYIDVVMQHGGLGLTPGLVIPQ